jgi:ERF superfamily
VPDQPASLAAALAELQQQLPRIAKNAQGQRSRYADLAEISHQLLPLLGKLGFAFTACPTMSGEQFVLAYRLYHAPSGETIGGDYPLPSSTPQTMGGAITYARRYCLLAVTGAAPDEDDDDAQVAEEAARAARAQRNHAPETRSDGSATDAELERMSRGPEPGAWRSTGTAENDPWQDEPGQPLDPPAETAFGSISPQQQTRMFAMFTGLKMRDREAQVAFIENVIGERVNSRKDLSYVQAGAVLEALEKAFDGNRP